MCGICGIIDFSGENHRDDLNAMASILHHRGPDNISISNCNMPQYSCGLGHARLSIIDLSKGANQPMEYEDLTIVFNGEIYNYKEIKSELEDLGHSFKLNSDTEVVLHAFKEWSKKCIDKFIGMFAFVIFNKGNNQLICCRDRAGVKPFYYYWKNNVFMFSSELKSFHQCKSFTKQIDLASVDLFMKFGYIPAPYSIYKNCHKLLSGHFLTLNLLSRELSIYKYWDVADQYKQPKLQIDYKVAKEQLHTIFKSAFEYRMVADVPVGVFLSGGYDSALVTSILQCNRSQRLKTFTIGFEEGNNEAPYAKKIAEYIGTDHTEYYCTYKEAKEIIPTLPFFYDEPFADSSAIPTILVSRLARNDVTVALSADGGDEVFAGYDSYASFDKNIRLLRGIPNFMHYPLSYLLSICGNLYPQHKQLIRLKIQQAGKLLENNKDLAFRLWKSPFVSTNSYQGKQYTASFIHYNIATDEINDNFDDMDVAQCLDYKYYLADDILTKVDRATMSVSLEGREPLLDHRIIEFVSQLPTNFKYNKGIKKRILKDIVYDYIPKELMDRPKTGFSIPICNWLQKDMKYLIDEYLCKSVVMQTGVFAIEYVEHTKNLFFNDLLYDKSELWKLLQFHMWYKQWN